MYIYIYICNGHPHVLCVENMKKQIYIYVLNLTNTDEDDAGKLNFAPCCNGQSQVSSTIFLCTCVP